MPNWTYCKLEAPSEVLEKYLTDNNGKPIFDFNKVIPRPEEYSDRELVAGGDDDLCIYWYVSERGKYSWKTLMNEFNPDTMSRLFNPYLIILSEDNGEQPRFDILTKKEGFDSDNTYRRGKKYMDVFLKYGYRNWYDWSYANWGTKWNANDTYYNKNGNESYVEFNTAWCPPIPVINKIFMENKGCDLKFTWYDEDYNGHHVIAQDKDGTYHTDEYRIKEYEWDYEEN